MGLSSGGGGGLGGGRGGLLRDIRCYYRDHWGYPIFLSLAGYGGKFYENYALNNVSF